MASVVLIRHGQASFGAADYDVLSETGRRQARVAGEALRGRLKAVRAVVTGSMRRQRDTAAACLEAMGLPPSWVEDAAWDEFDHEDVLRVYEPRWGDHAQLHRDLDAAALAGAFESAFHAAVARWTAGTHDAEYRETWPGFLARVDGALARLPQASGGTVLVFTSGGPISAACRAHLGAADAAAVFAHAFRLANTSVTTLEIGPAGSVLAAFNDHAHLTMRDEALLTFR
ncbi:MAG: histidine phosphatase family protein [Acidobacteriota bacterium]